MKQHVPHARCAANVPFISPAVRRRMRRFGCINTLTLKMLHVSRQRAAQLASVHIAQVLSLSAPPLSISDFSHPRAQLCHLGGNLRAAVCCHLTTLDAPPITAIHTQLCIHQYYLVASCRDAGIAPQHFLPPISLPAPPLPSPRLLLRRRS
jgi:hypothetical protein